MAISIDPIYISRKFVSEKRELFTTWRTDEEEKFLQLTRNLSQVHSK